MTFMKVRATARPSKWTTPFLLKPFPHRAFALTFSHDTIHPDDCRDILPMLPIRIALEKL